MGFFSEMAGGMIKKGGGRGSDRRGSRRTNQNSRPSATGYNATARSPRYHGGRDVQDDRLRASPWGYTP